eukprot:TRINITY_DN61813_c0_g1_i1.p1 TRINITY_DN61813_c0_g1~~TRINITY_DN61813_c0_g1_i1.p1  ORF type:complete len:355 (+),score=51.25 TRINITY_DN61813_c0_g1_i1:56-1066(+)
MEVMFHGFYAEDVTLEPGERVFVDYSCFGSGITGCFKYFCCPPCSHSCRTTMKNLCKQRGRPVIISDARQKEQEEGLSKKEFFDKYGFVLLHHETQMKAEDWLVNTAAPLGATRTTPLASTWSELDSPVKAIYAKEIDPLLRELLPDTAEVFYPQGALRRGPGGPNNFYGQGVHQDFGIYPMEMRGTAMHADMHEQGSFEKWLERLQDKATGGYSIINFWRPVLPMAGPVEKKPLAVCDPNTVRMSDIVPQDLRGFVPGGQTSMGLKFDPEQKWYYYPNMTKDEVLVFRQFHFKKGTSPPYTGIDTVFHTAFDNPSAPSQAEARCSSEYRVAVWLK